MAKDRAPEKAPKKAEKEASPQEQAQGQPQGQTQVQPQGETQPGIQVVAQYIKDFSFESPNAPESLVAGWPQPETNVQIFLRHAQIRDDAYECSVNFKVEAKKPGGDNKVAFIVDLTYGALVLLKNVP